MTNRSKWCPLLFFVSNLLLVSTVFAAPALSPSLQRDLSVLLRAPKAKQEIVIIAKGADAELIENKDAIAQFKRSKRDLPYSHGAVVEVSSADLERLLSFREETHEILLNEKIFKGAEAENNQIIGTLAANQLGFGGAGVDIAIIDTGVDFTHPSLGGCFGAGCKVRGGFNAITPSALPVDDHGHGTHVAGIAAGLPHANGFQGVAPAANILALKALDQNNQGTLADVLEALNWVVDNHQGPTVVNLSLTVPGIEYSLSNCFQYLGETVWNRLESAGIPVVVATGNDGFTNGYSFPACVDRPNLVRVAATYMSDRGARTYPVCSDLTTERDQLVCFSNRNIAASRGEYIAAPGSGISSTVPGGGFAVASGTSQAAPHVAGALAALLVGYPNARLSQLKRLLVSAGDLRARDPLSTVLAPRLHFGDAALAPSQGFVRKDDGRIPIVAFDIPGVQNATNASFSLFAGEESSASVYSMVTGTNLNLGVSSHFGLVDTIHHRWWEFGFSNTSGSLQDGFAEITFVLPAALQGIFSHFHFQLVGWEPTQVGEVPAGFVLGKKSSVQVELP